MSKDIPAIRIERMKRELNELQKELEEIEVEERKAGPLNHQPEDQISAKQSMQTIDGLRKFMHSVVGSSKF